ncbi:MAG: radical SAM protein [Candidatus Baldrarchaeia archaeon]
MSPQEFIRETIRLRCQGTSISFNEPTLLFEWSIDVFRLARENQLYNTYVTNGYMTEEALKLLHEAGLDAMNVDIKGCSDAVKKFCKADVEVVWRNCRLAKEMGIHVEVTTLIIPGVNNDLECLRTIAQRIVRELGEDTPWHVTRYYPAYKYNEPPPLVSFLESVRNMGMEEGLKYVYLGNVPGHPYENTYCPECGELLIKRYVFDIVEYKLTDENKCPKCGYELEIVGKYVKRSLLDKIRWLLS